jgi:hypothetical protein
VGVFTARHTAKARGEAGVIPGYPIRSTLARTKRPQPCEAQADHLGAGTRSRSVAGVGASDTQYQSYK